jgi:leucyl aminopeptidase (aminopeptidase T)
MNAFPPAAWDAAARNVGDLLAHAIEYAPPQQALVVFDQRCPLAEVLSAAYRAALPAGRFIDFGTVQPDEVLAAFEQLQAGDLVVLVQTTSFRLNEYRIRMELFKRGLKVIEHMHLSRMPGEQGLVYIDALAYDPAYYRGVGHALKARIERAQSGVVESGGERLVFASPFEEAKLNIGDYGAMKNVGGLFPIGEVFTEAQDLEAVSGRAKVFVFGDTTFHVNRPATPITMIVEKGRVVGAENSTSEFDKMLEIIRAHEGEVWVRELGFGMNRAFSRERTVDDIGTYERMCGIHLSLGAKHGQYQKPQFKRKDARFHVDVFVQTDAVYLDDEQVYRDGRWVPPTP